MKRAIKIISVFTLVLLCLSGCKKKEEASAIDKFLEIVETSEQSYKAYQEKDTMTDGTEILYTKEIKFQVERNEDVTKINTNYEKKETKLENLEPTITSYKTVGDKKYVGSNVSTYEIPNYWFNWNLKKEYLPEDYQLDIEDNTQVLTCSISSNHTKNFFMDDSINIDHLQVTIHVADEKVTTLNASYVSSNGYQVFMEITYQY